MRKCERPHKEENKSCEERDKCLPNDTTFLKDLKTGVWMEMDGSE
jgi:hypothetical protein